MSSEHDHDKDHLDELKSLLEHKNAPGISALLAQMHAQDIARALSALEENEGTELFRHLTPELASEVLLEVDERLRKTLILSITPA
ncbi:MAG: hypothetical protein OEV28_13510, partial [Nitrospirota bacterium]|nr:hypothetical protein [Nitrospirota bacterium]